MIKDRQTKESERPGDTGIEGLQHHRGAERPRRAGAAVRGGQAACRLGITWNTAPVLVKRLQGGETADVLILNRAGMDTMIRDERVRAGSEVTLASSATALAIKAGAPRPDISTPEALKRTLLAARAISYSDPAAGGASGIYFAKLLERLRHRRRGQRQDEVSAARRPVRRPPAERRGRPRRAAEARAAAGSRHRDPGAAARRPAHGHGVRRWRRSVERASPRRRQALIDFLRSPACGGGLPRQGARSGLTGHPHQLMQTPRLRAWLSVPEPMLNPLQHDCHPERSEGPFLLPQRSP